MGDGIGGQRPNPGSVMGSPQRNTLQAKRGSGPSTGQPGIQFDGGGEVQQGLGQIF